MTDVPNHMKGLCDRCGSPLDENGSNMTVISTSSRDKVTVRCDECEKRHKDHMDRLYGPPETNSEADE